MHARTVQSRRDVFHHLYTRFNIIAISITIIIAIATASHVIHSILSPRSMHLTSAVAAIGSGAPFYAAQVHSDARPSHNEYL